MRQIHKRNESAGVQPIVMGEMPKLRHLSPNAAVSTRNQELKDMMLTDPNADKSFGTQKRFFKPKQELENSIV